MIVPYQAIQALGFPNSPRKLGLYEKPWACISWYGPSTQLVNSNYLFIYTWASKASFTVLLQPKCSWCEFSPPLVVRTLFGHFWQKESLLNLPIFNPIRSGGGGVGSDARMTNSHLPFRNFLSYDSQML